MGFDAGTSVAPLDWDFTKYGGGSGTSPEPSTSKIEKFFRGWNALQQSILKTKTAAIQEMTPEQAKEQLQQWAGLSADEAYERAYNELEALSDTAEMQKHNDRMTGLVAELTGGCPGVDDIGMLPHRVRVFFFRWIIKEMDDPEPYAAVTKRSLTAINGG